MAADVSEQGYDDYCQEEDDEGTTSSSSASCGCFRGIICSSWRRSGGYVLYQKEAEIEDDDEEEGAVKEKWWEKKMKKVKVLSELLGGPKWKNFLRYRFRMIRTNQKTKKMQFQYDPKSYALNFDEGCVDFSARFASPVVGDTRQ
ncbi:hypothetical protein K1719_022638 [Acacia pycnantha]|nr:hypothetical protein K1719_022638 [Acacia pycnantha]